MSARHKRAKKRIKVLEEYVLRAANHIDSAADVIEESGVDFDGEADEERAFAENLRTLAAGTGYW